MGGRLCVEDLKWWRKPMLRQNLEGALSSVCRVYREQEREVEWKTIKALLSSSKIQVSKLLDYLATQKNKTTRKLKLFL
jgi:DNA-binding NtrC family response regulator